MNTINISKLENLIGKTVSYRDYEYEVIQVEKQGDSVVVKTDNKPIIFHNQAQVNFFVEDVVEVTHAVQVRHEPTAAVAQVIGNEVLDEVKNQLLENIRRLKTDKEYIPQAKAMAQQVNALVQLTHLEISARKALHKGDI